MSQIKNIISCNNIPDGLKNISVITQCDAIANGALRLQTLFQYPDGSSIDTFLDCNDDLIHPYKLSDYGQTATYLLDIPINPWGTSKRKKAISEICQRLNVLAGEGELYIRLSKEDLSTAGHAIVRLCQACIRVSDLSMTKRFRSVSSFRDDVEEFISQNDFQFISDEEAAGRFGNVVRIDFSVAGRSTKNFIQTLSTSHPSAAHQVANEVFTKWYDLEAHRGNYGFVSLYNSDSVAFRDEDLRRLETISTVLGFPAQADAIAESLAA